MIYSDSYYAFLLKIKTLFRISSSFAELALKNNIRHTYFVEPRDTRFEK